MSTLFNAKYKPTPNVLMLRGICNVWASSDIKLWECLAEEQVHCRLPHCSPHCSLLQVETIWNMWRNTLKGIM